MQEGNTISRKVKAAALPAEKPNTTRRSEQPNLLPQRTLQNLHSRARFEPQLR
jgi:hypothetical protein